MTFRDWRAFTGALIVGVLIIAIPAVNAWAKAIGTPTIRSYQQWQKTTGPVITGGAHAQSNPKRPENPVPMCAGNGYWLVSITSTYAVAAGDPGNDTTSGYRINESHQRHCRVDGIPARRPCRNGHYDTT